MTAQNNGGTGLDTCLRSGEAVSTGSGTMVSTDASSNPNSHLCHLPDCCSELSKSFVCSDGDGIHQDTSFGGMLGAKTIGLFGSFCLITNNITGPGMLHIAYVFQQSGWIVPLLVFLGICVGSAGAATLLCDAMARMPGNESFEIRYEFSDIIAHYLGRKWYAISHVSFYLGIFTQCAASIVGTAQSMDSLIAYVFGKTWALHVTGPHHTPWFIAWSPGKFCGHYRTETDCMPFSHIPHRHDHGHDIGMVLSGGYMFTLITMMPLGFLNLDDNIKFQIMSFWVLVVLCGEFLVEMVFVQGQDQDLLPAMGLNYSTMLGTIIFNFAYCPTLPSWMNEKRPDVPTSKVLWSSALFSSLMYILLGVTGAMAFPNAETNLLQVLGAEKSSAVTRVCSYLFGSLVIGLGIPVFCIVMRYDLVVGGSPTFLATSLGVVLPWFVSWLLYQGQAASTFISLSGVVLISAIGFILPLVAAIVAASGESVSVKGRCIVTKLCGKTSQLRSTVVRPVPDWLLPHQRRYAAALICIMVPAVLVGFANQVVDMAEGGEN